MSREIRCEFEINATIDEVWQALVEAEHICRWFAPYSESEPGPDGFIGLAWKDSQDIERMTFSAWEPPSRLILNWHAAPAGVTPIRLPVEFQLTQSNGKTTLKLVQSGFLSDEPEMSGIKKRVVSRTSIKKVSQSFFHAVCNIQRNSL